MGALTTKVYTMSNLVTFGANGISVASYVDIKKAIITQMRTLYGENIDVSDASADGQYISAVALMMNNALQALNELYSDLNPATAKGKALDILASFSNISRTPAQASICDVIATYPNYNTSDVSKEIDIAQDTSFVDKNGNEWSIDSTRAQALSPFNDNGTPKYKLIFTSATSEVAIPLICDITGPIECSANTIDGFMEVTSESSSIVITQPENGLKGAYSETDNQLRARRNNSAADESKTVLDGLAGSLSANSSIVDAKVLNHTDNHNVEVLIRRRYKSTTTTLDSLDDFIADTIYNKLTPGIPAVYIAGTNNIKKEAIRSGTEIADLDEIIQWASCIPLMLTIKITLTKIANYDATNAASAIKTAVCNYFENLSLQEDFTTSALLQVILYADPMYMGRSTYTCLPTDITINDTLSITGTLDSTISANAQKTYYEETASNITINTK